MPGRIALRVQSITFASRYFDASPLAGATSTMRPARTATEVASSTLRSQSIVTTVPLWNSKSCITFDFLSSRHADRLRELRSDGSRSRAHHIFELFALLRVTCIGVQVVHLLGVVPEVV